MYCDFLGGAENALAQNERVTMNLVEYYNGLYAKYGDDERSLGWTKHKQDVRFKQLFRYFEFKENESVLDIGCGFGDLRTYLNEACSFDYKYTGIDMVDAFVKRASKTNSDENASFIFGDFLDEDILPDNLRFDYVCGSGIFGIQIYEDNEQMFSYIDRIMTKSVMMANVGVSFNFLSDKVDFSSGALDFHASPERVLQLAYNHSKNVILDNSVMPFEFTVTIFSDQSFETSNTIFNRYLKNQICE